MLKIHGNYHSTELIKTLQIQPYSIEEKGNLNTIKKRGINSITTCKFDVSKADFEAFEQQKIEAIAFLKLHYDNLLLLNQFDIETMYLDFGIASPFLDKNIAAAYFRFPSELLRLAGNLGIDIELSEYF